MAKKSNAKNATNKEHQARSNSAMRTDVLRECATHMRRIQSARAILNEDASGVRERLRNINVDPKAWLFSLRIIDMEDAAARDAFLDTVRETFDSMGEGGQLDWVKTQERHTGRNTEKVDEGAEKDATKEGPVGKPASA